MEQVNTETYYIPTKVLVIYKDSSNMATPFVEMADYVAHDQIGAFRMIDTHTVEDLIASQTSIKSIAYNKDDRIHFFEKRNTSINVNFKTEPCTFNLKRSLGKDVKVLENFKLPEVFWTYEDGTLYAHVDDFKGDGADIPLALPNIFDNGRVCTGSMTIAKDCTEVTELVDSLLFAFKNSNFTVMHMSKGDKLLKHLINYKEPFIDEKVKQHKRR